METTYILVLAILSIQSSYLEDKEIPAERIPDTVQFWYSPGITWRVKTYAIDHDIHIGSVRRDHWRTSRHKMRQQILPSTTVTLSFKR